MPLIDGKMYGKGDMVTLNSAAARYANGCPPGTRVMVHHFRPGEPNTVALYSPDRRIDGWHDLEGEVGNNRGWYVTVEEFRKIVEPEEGQLYEISKTVTHKGRDLKGIRGRQLVTFQNGLVFLELEENIGGCSGDGLGKSGHCIAVNPSFIKKIKEERSESANTNSKKE